MSDSGILALLIGAVALIEGRNGVLFALRSRSVLRSAGLPSPSNSDILLQEFGVYSLAICAGYLIAICDSERRPGILFLGLVINLCAALMHLSRSFGFYFGGVQVRLSPRSERHQGYVHLLSTALLGAAFLQGSVPVET